MESPGVACRIRRKLAVAGMSLLLTVASGCATRPPVPIDTPGRNADELLVVDCLLPGQLRRLGQIMAFVTPQRPIRTSASICELRGGEYVAYDRANFATALKVWLPKAQDGDAEAQTYVGEIYEKGLGLEPDLEVALDWYAKAAEQGFSRAQINLGFLYESGLGVERDLTRAMNYYRAASGFTEARLEYVTSIEAANREAEKRQLVDLQAEVARLAAVNAELESEQSSLSARQDEVARLKARIEAERSRVVETAAAAPEAASPDTDARLASALAEIADLDRQLDTSQSEQRRLYEQLASRQVQTSELRKRYAAADLELSHARDAIRERERRIENLLAELDELDPLDPESWPVADEPATELRAELEAELARERALTGTLSAGLARSRSAASAETRAIEAELARAEAAEAELSEQLDARASRIETLESELRAGEARYRQELADVRGQMASLETENAALQGDLAGQRARTDAERLAGAEARAELDAANAAIAASAERQEARIAELREQLDEAGRQLAAGRADTAEERRLAELSADLERQLARADDERKRLMEKLMDAQLEVRRGGASAAAELARLEQELQEKERIIDTQQADIGELQSVVTRTRARLDQPEIEQILQLVNAGPTIEVIEPPTLLTRGRPVLSSPPGSSVVNVVGRVDPVRSLLTLQINGVEGEVNANGVFKHALDLQSGEALRMVAIDDAGERTELEFDLARGAAKPLAPEPPPSDEPPVPPELPAPNVFGNYHALIIGNNDYRHLQDLRTAGNDAIAVEKMLRTRYGFETELLLDADRYALLSALNRKRDELTEEDNLLIYYAGHGELSNAKGFWMPVDAEPDNTSNWVANSSITDLVESMRAKHVMIMADSCYSGSLTRSSLTRLRADMTDEQQRSWYEAVSSLKVRTVFTSGGVKPVIDGASGATHSLFAEALLGELDKGSGIVQAYDLFLAVRDRVREAARKLSLDQTPQYSPIRFAGHESGEFLFVSGDASERSASLSTDMSARGSSTDDSRSLASFGVGGN